ncbi:MAG: hypothetical protein GF307_10515 [candidate division Zixibacteria bacterium]|nr:hypothetical protein [candidate division Zixibacteria bacterium]
MSLEPLIGVAFFYLIGFIVKIISDNRLRKQLIEKGMVDENLKYLYQTKSNYRTSLKWGMVLVGIGVAFMIGQFLPHDLQNGVMISGAFILAGLALLVFYIIERNIDKTDTP